MLVSGWGFRGAVRAFRFGTLEAEGAGGRGRGGEESGDGAGGAGGWGGVEVEKGADVGFVCSGHWIAFIDERKKEALFMA